jgi:uncharacterized protein (TIGR03435 family)
MALFRKQGCSMKLMLCLGVLIATLTLPAAAQDITGQWQGVIKTPNKDLRVIVKITKDDAKLQGMFYSIDQPQAPPFRATGTRFEGGTLTFGIDLIGGKYEGKLGGDGKTINGTWTQGQTPLPLVLTRATTETAWEIPAPPPPPKLMAPDADPSFEVATIKPNPSGNSGLQQLTVNGRNFRIRNGSLGDLIGFAYAVQTKQIVNGPDWMDSDRYDIDAVPDKEGQPSPAQLRVMVQKLLAERFGLKTHTEKRDLPAFVLAEAKTGVKITPTQMNGPLPGFGMSPGEGGLRMNVMNGTMDEFTGFLQMIIVDRPVVNHTELKGRYDFHVTFTPDESQFHGHPPNLARPPAAAAASDPATPTTESAANLFEAMQQQAGLRLSPEKTAVDVVVIDHVEKPSAN